VRNRCGRKADAIFYTSDAGAENDGNERNYGEQSCNWGRDGPGVGRKEHVEINNKKASQQGVVVLNGGQRERE